MACEVQAQTYLFRPLKRESAVTQHDDSDVFQTPSTSEVPNPLKVSATFEIPDMSEFPDTLEDPNSLIPFRFNFLHDVESTWWIAVWCLFHTVPLDVTEPTSGQYQMALKLFPDTGDTIFRQNAFSIAGIFRNMIKDLPDQFRSIAMQMERMRSILVGKYADAEAHPNVNVDHSTNIHSQVLNGYMASQKLCMGAQIQAISAKRRRVDIRGDDVSMGDQDRQSAKTRRTNMNSGQGPITRSKGKKKASK